MQRTRYTRAPSTTYGQRSEFIVASSKPQELPLARAAPAGRREEQLLRSALFLGGRVLASNQGDFFLHHGHKKIR